MSALLPESHDGRRGSLCGRGVALVDCHWLAAWEMCPRFVSSIPDPLLEDHVLQTAAVLLAQEEAFTRAFNHPVCLASGWPTLAHLAIGACEQASCSGSSLAWSSCGPYLQRARLAGGSQGGRSGRQQGACRKGRLHGSPGPAVALTQHTQGPWGRACRRSWQTLCSPSTRLIEWDVG